MKKRVLVSLSLVLVMALVGACGKGKMDYSIAISQQLEHSSLDETRKGFIQALKDAGIEEGKNLKIDFNNAQNDTPTSKNISQKIAGSKHDLALGIATMSSQNLAEDVTNMPVLFAAVTDPVDAGIVSQLEKPGGNVTGRSDTNPEAIRKTIDFIADEMPEVKTIGIIINKGEPNAVVMAENAANRMQERGLTLVEAPVVNSADVQQAAESLIGRVDAFLITLDNNVVSAVQSIIEVSEKNSIPFFASDYDSVEAGAFLAHGFRYFDHGYEVGEMAVDILKNGKDPGEMDITMPQRLDFIMNMKAAAAQGVDVTEKMKEYVKDKDINMFE